MATFSWQSSVPRIKSNGCVWFCSVSLLSSISYFSVTSMMALWMCIPGAFFPFLSQAAIMFLFVFYFFTGYFFIQKNINVFQQKKVQLFNQLCWIVQMSCTRSCLFSPFHHIFFSLILNLSYIFCMHGETLQKGQSWPGRKICTFSIFVLCTALLILNPIIYYLNPSIKKDLLNVHFVCM